MGLTQGKGRTATRYLAVSVINVVNHQVVLYLANSVWGWPGGPANIFAAVVAAGPAYVLSRAWVWEVTGKHSFKGEILPFWIMAMIGLVVSTAMAWAAASIFGEGLMVNIASLAGYFLVWLAKFLLLDRLFGLEPGVQE